MDTNKSGYPSFKVSHVAGRVKVPAALLTFYGLDLPDLVGDRSHRNTASGEARAEFQVNDDDGATVNGVPVSCRYGLRLGWTWTPEKDANGDNVRAILWHWHEGSTSRTDAQFHPAAPEGASSALHALAVDMVNRYATPEVLRSAIAAQLAYEAGRASGRAAEKRGEWEEAQQRAEELAVMRDTFAAGAALFGARRTSNADPLEFASTNRKACERYARDMYVHTYDRNEGKLPECVELVPAAS